MVNRVDGALGEFGDLKVFRGRNHSQRWIRKRQFRKPRLIRCFRLDMANFNRHVQNGSKLPLPMVMATRKKNPARDQKCGKHAKQIETRAGIPSPLRVGAIPHP